MYLRLSGIICSTRFKTHCFGKKLYLSNLICFLYTACNILIVAVISYFLLFDNICSLTGVWLCLNPRGHDDPGGHEAEPNLRRPKCHPDQDRQSLAWRVQTKNSQASTRTMKTVGCRAALFWSFLLPLYSWSMYLFLHLYVSATTGKCFYNNNSDNIFNASGWLLYKGQWGVRTLILPPTYSYTFFKT